MTTTGQVRHAFPAFKVYIFGVDVTEDVLNVEIKYHTGKSPNICTVTLANDLDKYILTTKEMVLFFGSKVREAIENKYMKLIEQTRGQLNDEQTMEQITESEILQQLDHIQFPNKRLVLLSKLLEKLDDIEAPDINDKTDGSHVRQLTGHVFRYPFHAEDPIFHANDPIRVFLRDPFNPSRWYHGFTGFLSDFDDHVDENNQKILTIVAEGPTKILRYARMATNPGIVDMGAIQVAKLDAIDRSFWEEGFYDITLPEYMFALIFGNDPNGDIAQPTGESSGKFSIRSKDAAGNARASQIRFAAAGRFNYGRSTVIEYGPKTTTKINEDQLDMGATPYCSVSTLEEYQSIIDHELKESDLYDLLDENVGWTATKTSGTRTQVLNEVNDYMKNLPRKADGTPDPHGLMDFLGKRTDLYPPDSGALIILIPASFHPETNRNILMKDLIQSPGMTTTFRSRLSMIYETIERIEFVFYESPKGDLICEFPLYDFDPDDWGFNEVKKNIVNGLPGATDRSVIPISYKSEFESKDIKCGPFAPRWIIEKRDTINFSKGITDEKVRTELACDWNLVTGWRKAVGLSTGILPPAVVQLKHLIPLYWARLEQADPKGHISSAEAAHAYAHITLNKMNADAKNLGINTVPNLGTWLNRPMYFLPRNCIGTLTSITHSVKWGMGGSMDTRLNINYIRGWDGLLDIHNNPVYTTIGGLPSRPLNYKLLFNLLEDVTSGNASPSGESEASRPTITEAEA